MEADIEVCLMTGTFSLVTQSTGIWTLVASTLSHNLNWETAFS